jgi:sugar phosphate isomerase/epimerase
VTVGMDDIGWVLWAGTVGLESALDARIEAAVAAGFSRVSISPLDVERAAEQGISAADVGRRFRDRGLGVVMDPVMNWYSGTTLPQSRFGRFSTAEALRMCADVEVVSLSAIGNPGAGGSVASLAEAFGCLCDQAADFGAQVHLEFMPASAIKDVGAAWAIVEAAGRPNGGLVFDTWHFFRGNPDYAALRQVPGERIFAVQIDDAYAEVRGSMREDTFHRLLPGKGDLDLATVVRELDAIGGLSWVGPEVMSPELEAMPAVDAATLAGGLVRELISSVRQHPAGT